MVNGIVHFPKGKFVDRYFYRQVFCWLSTDDRPVIAGVLGDTLYNKDKYKWPAEPYLSNGLVCCPWSLVSSCLFHTILSRKAFTTASLPQLTWSLV